jgi:hypothetical protein
MSLFAIGGGLGRRAGLIGAIVLIGTSALACTAARVTDEQASAGATPTASSSATVTPIATWQPPLPTPTPEPTSTPIATWAPEETFAPNPTEQPSATPTPPLVNGPLPQVGLVPAGTWASINWIAVPGGHAPAVPTISPDLRSPDFALHGWSRGFVEFAWNSKTRTIVPWSSADGLNWTSGLKLDTRDFAAGLKDYDQSSWGPDGHDFCSLEMDIFEEGPHGLLARAWLACGDGCGGPRYVGPEMWSSPDGLSWARVDVSAAVGAAGLSSISGGSNGFLALGGSTDKEAVWTSTDGRNWRQGALPAEAFDGSAWLGSPASFAGGFVLSGVVLSHGGGCVAVGPTDLLKTGSLWWSPDGKTWTRDGLPGTTPGQDVAMTVVRISDQGLLARQRSWTYDNTRGSQTEVDAAWTSSDGKTWKLISTGPDLTGLTVLTDGSHGIGYDQSDWTKQPTVCSFRADLTPVALSQTGNLPWIGGWSAALGPTGLLVTNDGLRFWIGVPVAG